MSVTRALSQRGSQDYSVFSEGQSCPLQRLGSCSRLCCLDSKPTSPASLSLLDPLASNSSPCLSWPLKLLFFFLLMLSVDFFFYFNF